MSNLATTAERLRLVKEANEKFLALWAADCIFDSSKALHAVLLDVAEQPISDFSSQAHSRFADEDGGFCG